MNEQFLILEGEIKAKRNPTRGLGPQGECTEVSQKHVL